MYMEQGRINQTVGGQPANLLCFYGTLTTVAECIIKSFSMQIL